ncbi:MAG TPA: hypothetical protein VGV40_08920 [Solirubrobacteraceae bacterium]|nr:hypothetical protein [Solirubrobacteraceae bacterium]
MLDPEAIAGSLDRLEEGLRECRAALEVLGDDPSAMGQLGETVDAMALEIAQLRGETTTERL